MRKVFVVGLVVLLFFGTIGLAYVLGIEAQGVSLSLSGYSYGIKVSKVYSGSLGSQFLQPGDVIIGAGTLSAWGPANRSSNLKAVVHLQSVSPGNSMASPLPGMQDFKDFLGILEDHLQAPTSNTTFLFLVQRGSRFLEATVGWQ
ncbi:MAG TPA: hypothetical protein P5560_07875 [Thermotogota bacterium]|nr:hypothetical protein [Thermotogota bacterium]